METSTDTGQLIAPAGVAGVVALKPTVGRVSRTGVLPVAKSQDSPGPITRTVYDAAAALRCDRGLRRGGRRDLRRAGRARLRRRPVGDRAERQAGRRDHGAAGTPVPYANAVTTFGALGATTVVKTVGTPSPNPPSIVTREFKRDLNAYLAGVPGEGAKSLARSSPTTTPTRSRA